jgi:hypothetical protein
MKTAVEWLVEKHFGSIENCSPNFRKHIEQANKIFEEQMCKFAYKCHNHYKVYGDFKIEQYYNKTFKSE